MHHGGSLSLKLGLTGGRSLLLEPAKRGNTQLTCQHETSAELPLRLLEVGHCPPCPAQSPTSPGDQQYQARLRANTQPESLVTIAGQG